MVQQTPYHFIGLSYDGLHDSNVAYLTDKIEYAALEERFSREKKDGRPPRQALAYLLANFDIDPQRVRFACPILPPARSEAHWQRPGVDRQLMQYPERRDSQRFGLEYIRQFAAEPVFVGHHDAHAASAYYTSGFGGKTLVLVIDAGNFFDPWCVSFYEGRDGLLCCLHQSPDSRIADGYALVTAALGFRPLHHEGKITGLAAFGRYNPALLEQLVPLLADPELVYQITHWENVGSREQPPRLVVNRHIERLSSLLDEFSREDIAFAVQALTEQKTLALLKNYAGQYDSICLAGGLFANVALNYKIKQLGFDQIFIHPAMGDDGLALGAALWAKAEAEAGLLPVRLPNVYFGPRYGSTDLPALFNEYGLVFEEHAQIEPVIARLLHAGKIVARFAGRLEYGPRALGNRSILYRADDASVNYWLNDKLNRTEFMPFAPAVCDYQAGELFKNLAGCEYAASFMTITLDCTETMKQRAPGAVHVDGTARPQIVSRGFNPSFYDILDHYYRLTHGQSILINTSFNMHGEPIVLTPRDAIASFLRSGLDVLAIENFIVTSAPL